ncbi:DUF6538 domain-containing protein [Defluviimonas sp. SAOS-178_SWC]|uniref:DUF6538 domain-containing protein n=1 Tax=Defluviimonas sp. SAOS-178_SWC TaxID=3121287 RepID=UPI00322198FA
MTKAIPHFHKTKSGRWKYQRKVPRPLQEIVGKAVWDFSLGSDYLGALDKCRSLTREHDDMIAQLATGEAQEAWTRRRQAEETAKGVQLGAVLAATLPPGAVVAPEDAEQARGIALAAAAQAPAAADLWRQTEDKMKRVRGLSDERDLLATFAAFAFGDRSYLDRLPADDPVGNALADIMHPTRPADPVAGVMFDAFKTALDARLSEVTPATAGDASLRITELMDSYSEGKRANTQRSYKAFIRRLTAAEGNHQLTHYTKPILQRHRDRLVTDGVSPQTVAKHFDSFKTLWRWAAAEKEAYEGLIFPALNMPTVSTTVEDRRWQAFDDDELKAVWGLVSDEWAPDSNSRLTPERRAAFIMAFRVALYSGMRPAEIFKLRDGDVKKGVLTIRETKTRGRKIPLARAIADLPDFLAAGGFEGVPASIATTMSDQFTKLIRGAGFANDRHVLYSTKDTLVERLTRQDGMSDDIIRGIIGHVSGQGKLRHYKTGLGDTPHGLEMMRKALDAITYW